MQIKGSMLWLLLIYYMNPPQDLPVEEVDQQQILSYSAPHEHLLNVAALQTVYSSSENLSAVSQPSISLSVRRDISNKDQQEKWMQKEQRNNSV